MKHYVYMVSENEETGERRLIKRCELTPKAFGRLLLGLDWYELESTYEQRVEERRRRREQYEKNLKEGWYGECHLRQRSGKARGEQPKRLKTKT